MISKSELEEVGEMTRATNSARAVANKHMDRDKLLRRNVANPQEYTT